MTGARKVTQQLLIVTEDTVNKFQIDRPNQLYVNGENTIVVLTSWWGVGLNQEIIVLSLKSAKIVLKYRNASS